MENYSVLMSVYKGEEPAYLRLSMESIFGQTIPTNDFVLMCDGPLTEALDCVIEEMLQLHGQVLHVVRLDENQGLSNALNIGLTYCQNELIARMDSDDVAVCNRCALQLCKFAEDPSLSILGGAVDEFEGVPEHVVSHKQMPETHEDILKYAQKRNPFNHPTVMFRKSVVVALGSYPHNMLHEDYALWANMLLSGYKGANLAQTLCCMRVDSGLYARRGGFGYFRQAVALRWGFYRRGLYTRRSFVCVVLGLFAVCLIPPGLRKRLYRRFLR